MVDRGRNEGGGEDDVESPDTTRMGSAQFKSGRRGHATWGSTCTTINQHAKEARCTCHGLAYLWMMSLPLIRYPSSTIYLLSLQR